MFSIKNLSFSVNHFAQMYARKVGIKADVLEKTLWGDYFLNAKSKRIFKGAQVRLLPAAIPRCVYAG